jgi:hypothetical protein
MARLSSSSLLIVRPDRADDEVAYSPAASIEIFGHGNLTVLRDALNDILPQNNKEPQS